MLTAATKRFILPFSATKRSLPEVEAAAVFAVAEFGRSKGGGLIFKQPQEQLVFLSKIGYPLWLFPKTDSAYIFDGLDNCSSNVSYFEVPSAKVFLENLEKASMPKENYMLFLLDNNNFFEPSPNETRFPLRGLIADLNFLGEFSFYRKEATEATGSINLALLSPSLEQAAISSVLAELEKLQYTLKEDADKLPECIRRINKTTGQYVTELGYEASAAVEEIDAKIKAQEEITTPQISKLNRDYKNKIKKLTDSFDQEIESLEKLQAKTEKVIADNEEKIKQYEHEAKAHAKKGHTIYEKRWKEKIKQTQKELDSLKKERKKTEGNLQKIGKQKTQETSKLYFELDAEVKFAREPLLQLQATRETKLLSFKKATQRLLDLEKPVIEGLNSNLKLRETVNANFEALTIKEQQLKTPSLFFVPFYIAAYEAGLSRRYLLIPPSSSSNLDVSTKLKGALGISKNKELLTPRFKSIANLVEKLSALIKQKSSVESYLTDLAQKNNLLTNRLFTESAARGVVYLGRDGWLSTHEQQLLNTALSS